MEKGVCVYVCMWSQNLVFNHCLINLPQLSFSVILISGCVVVHVHSNGCMMLKRMNFGMLVFFNNMILHFTHSKSALTMRYCKTITVCTNRVFHVNRVRAEKRIELLAERPSFHNHITYSDMRNVSFNANCHLKGENRNGRSGVEQSWKR